MGGGKRERESGWGLKVTWFPVQRTPCDSTPSCLSFCNLWPLRWHQNGNQLLCWWSAETSWKITTPQKKNGVSSVGCLFCLHRLTVDREGGRTMFYRLFNQCFPHKRFTQKFHRPIPDWSRIWWNLGLSLLILTAAKVHLANQLSILWDFSFISFFNPSTRMMQSAMEVRNFSFMRTPVCTGDCRLVALIWPVHDDGNRMRRESFIRDWDRTGCVWTGVNIHSAKVYSINSCLGTFGRPF